MVHLAAKIGPNNQTWRNNKRLTREIICPEQAIAMSLGVCLADGAHAQLNSRG